MKEFIGRYQILAEIGAGGMGTVYRAFDPEIQRQVALKWLPRHFSRDPSFAERFRREAQVIGRLEHPHIIPIYDVGADEGRPFIVMRLLTGGTLRARIRREDYDVQALLTTLEQVADALEVAHTQGIIHRDLKPSNILFDDRGLAFLSDFGIAKVLDAATQLTGSGVIGTPAYMSPEQFTGRDIGGASDQYALAVVAFESLAGRLPFEGETTAQVMFKHLTEVPPDIHAIARRTPATVTPILKKALAKDSKDRYESVLVFVASLRTAIEADPDMAYAALTIIEPSPSRPITPPPSKPPTPAPRQKTPPPSTPTTPPPRQKTPPPRRRTTPPPSRPVTPPPATGAPRTPAETARLDHHYQKALEAMNRSDWQTALAAFDQVMAVDATYLNTRRLREQAAQMLTRASARPAATPVESRPATATPATGPADVAPRTGPFGLSRRAILGGIAAMAFLGILFIAVLAFGLTRLLGGEDGETGTPLAQLEMGTGTPAASLASGEEATATPEPGETLEAQFLEITAAGRGAKVREPGMDSFKTIAAGDKVMLAPGTTLQAGDETFTVVLPDGTELYLASATEIELMANSESDAARLLLADGRLLATGNKTITIEVPSGEVSTATGVVGVSFDSRRNALTVDCFSGNCALGDEGESLSLVAGEYSEIVAGGAPTAPEAARAELYCTLASELVPCPEPTATPTPTRTPTKVPSPTLPPATFTPVPPTLPPPTLPPPTLPPPTLPPPTQPPPPPPTEPPPPPPEPTEPPPPPPEPTEPPPEPTEPPPPPPPRPTYTPEPP